MKIDNDVCGMKIEGKVTCRKKRDQQDRERRRGKEGRGRGVRRRE